MKSILEKRGKVLVYEKPYQFFSAGKTSLDNHKELIFITKGGDL
jgi:adenine-specific DNA-methyltransferase